MWLFAGEFHKAAPLDALIVTRLDGSGKGGIAITIQDELKIPTRFIGTGEEPEAFAIFRRDAFVQEIPAAPAHPTRARLVNKPVACWNGPDAYSSSIPVGPS